MSATSLSAVLIVRDEAAFLADCLSSLTGVVDDILVHDTGSVDDTVEIARRFGATVSTGRWSGDFAAARNVVLGACRSDWALSIDADERLECPGRLRELLADVDADVLTVDVHNVHHAMSYSHRAPRLLRVATVRWAGRVHEQPVRRDGGPARVIDLDAATATLRHLGYADEAAQRCKSRRNAELAAAELAALDTGEGSDTSQISYAAFDLARSVMSAGDAAGGIAALEDVRRRWPGDAAARSATDALARHHLAVGDDALVLELVDDLRRHGADLSYCDWLLAQALAQLGRIEDAWELLRPIGEVIDTDGRRYPAEHVAQMRALLEQVINTQRRFAG